MSSSNTPTGRGSSCTALARLQLQRRRVYPRQRAITMDEPRCDAARGPERCVLMPHEGEHVFEGDGPLDDARAALCAVLRRRHRQQQIARLRTAMRDKFERSRGVAGVLELIGIGQIHSVAHRIMSGAAAQPRDVAELLLGLQLLDAAEDLERPGDN